jgi:hypothetical protein
MKYILFLVMFFSVNALSETITYECQFINFSDSKGNHKEKKPFALTYLIDGDTKKAYLLGNAGSSEVIPIVGDGQISFIEVTVTGNVMTTTIVGGLHAVHSRNSAMLGQLLASQYYGSCIEK